MIQFKRGSSENWKKLKKPLAAGQPGYDRDRKKLKIGDGTSSWSELPYVSGMSAEEILSSEKDAKDRVSKVPGLGLIGNAFSKILSALKLDDRPIFTYGEELPDDDTVGRVYLQCYDTAPEVDYVIEYGIAGIWTYRKWRSGLAECFGTLSISTTVQAPAGNLYSDNKAMKSTDYPPIFIEKPNEVASLQSPGGIVWLTGRAENTAEHTALYSILSVDKQVNDASYKIGLYVVGRWQ